MIRFLVPMLLICNIAWAGIVVCPDTDGEVTSTSLSSSQIASCLYYSDTTHTQQQLDDVRNLIRNNQRTHLEIVSGDIVLKSQADRDAVDAAVVSARTTRTNLITSLRTKLAAVALTSDEIDLLLEGT